MFGRAFRILSLYHMYVLCIWQTSASGSFLSLAVAIQVTTNSSIVFFITTSSHGVHPTGDGSRFAANADYESVVLA
jgi:hypothetical protein